MEVESVIQLAHGLLLDHVPLRAIRTASGWITFNCVWCQDRRKRAGIIETGARISYHCFNCGFKAGWTPGSGLSQRYRDLAQRLGAGTEEINKVILALLKHGAELERIDPSTQVHHYVGFPSVELPADTQLISDLPEDHELKKYARDRGVLELTPLLHFPSDLAQQRRIIVPFMFNNEIVGWTGRHVAPGHKSVPKYLGHTPRGYVYNIDRFLGQRQVVVLVEGVLDAVLLDCAAVMSNGISTEQATLVERLGKRVVVMPDRDAAGQQLIQDAVKYGWEVSFPPWPRGCKDAADACRLYGRMLTLSSILTHAVSNPVKIKVQAKLGEHA